MSELRWRRPMGQLHLMAGVGMLAMAAVIFIPFALSAHVNLRMIGAIGLLLAANGVGMYFSYRRWRDVWHSISTFIQEPAHIIIPRMIKALTDGNVPFTRATSVSGKPVSSLKLRWDEVLELNYGELRLNLMAREGTTIFFLGPVKKWNEDDVGRVKELIERVALGAQGYSRISHGRSQGQYL